MSEMDVKKLHPRLLLIIIARNAEPAAAELLRICHVPVHFQTPAVGTASSEILDMLGLENDEKSLLLCMAPKFRAEAVMNRMRRHPLLSAAGIGVAFSVPLTGISRPAVDMLDHEARERMIRRMEREMDKGTAELQYSLVLAIANQGFSDDIVQTAKEAGAKGGTVIHARRVGMEDTLKVWGISVQEEKELILIAVRREDKAPIMRAIATRHGIATPAHAVALSLPVDGMVGLDRDGGEDSGEEDE